MSQVYIRFGSKLVQLVLLISLSLCVVHPGLAVRRSEGPTASADPAAQPTIIPDIRTQTIAHERLGGASENVSSIAEGEPLLLLLFGSILFFVATLIKLKLSRKRRTSSQYFEQWG